MDLLTGLAGGVIQNLLAKPEVQAMVLGVVVKAVVDKLKDAFKMVDANGVPEDLKGKVQLLALAASALANLANGALNHSLSGIDPTNTVNALVGVLATFLFAQGTHQAVKPVVKALKK